MNVLLIVLLTSFWSYTAWRLWRGNRASVELMSWNDAFSELLTNEKVSIVIAARNEADRLEETISGLLSQRHLDFELVVVDDRSTDETGVIAQTASERDARVRYVRVDDLPEGWPVSYTHLTLPTTPYV